jgi:3-oxo-5-alpha-steroid 4-dehydrogenase 1
MDKIYSFLLFLIFSSAVLVLVLLFFISAPYGKFLRKGWGSTIHAKWAWLFMELPSPLLMTFFFITSGQKGLPQYIFILLWLSHYIDRTFIYPFTQSGKEKPYPLIIVAMALVFNCINGFINGYGLFHVSIYSFSWVMKWQFASGLLIFITGFVVNKVADEKLRKLRKANPGDYLLPQGWLFKYISCPHYFGEIIEWAGWAVLTWSLPGLAFSVFTFANLFPRAIASHKWYKSNFPEYPENRKAVIPFII